MLLISSGRDDEVGLGVGGEVPGPAGHLRGSVVGLGHLDPHVATVGIHERQRVARAPDAVGTGQEMHVRVEHVEDETRSGCQVRAHRSQAAHQVGSLVQVEQRVGCDEHEIERAAEVEVAHVALHPLHRHPALGRLAPSLGEHVRRELQAGARMPVGGDGDQLVPGAAPQLQDAPALPIRLGPVEVDGRPDTREQPVVQLRVRVEPFAHGAHPPRPAGTVPAVSPGLATESCVLARHHGSVPTAPDDDELELIRRSGVVLRVGRLSLSAGTGSYRVKASMARIAHALGIDRHEAHVTLTEITTTSHRGPSFRTEVTEVRTIGVNVDRLTELEHLAGRVDAAGHVTPDERHRRAGPHRRQAAALPGRCSTRCGPRSRARRSRS